MSEPVKLQPVQSYDQPGYPTRHQHESGDEPLERHWPDAWKYGKGFLKGLVVAAGLNAAGCSTETAGVPPVELPIETVEVDSDDYLVFVVTPHPLVAQAADWTREIYDNGRWVMLGCVVMMPSTFTPEDEAKIEADLRKIMVERSE